MLTQYWRRLFLAASLFALTATVSAASEAVPNSDRAPTSSPKMELVTGLPYSTQWIYERTNSFVYLSYNSAQMQDTTLSIAHYSADYGTKSFGYPSIDLFNHMFSFGGVESSRASSAFSIWGRYSLGFAHRSGSLSDSQVMLDSSFEKSSLLLLSTRIGALLSYDFWDSFKPYVGMEIAPYFFRQSADITGVEQQGASYSYGPVFGAHVPLLFGGKASILTEYRLSIAGHGSRILGDSQAFTAGMGLAL